MKSGQQNTKREHLSITVTADATVFRSKDLKAMSLAEAVELASTSKFSKQAAIRLAKATSSEDIEPLQEETPLTIGIRYFDLNELSRFQRFFRVPTSEFQAFQHFCAILSGSFEQAFKGTY
jgi:hypothetical protein